jgi:hypothetical protein
LGTTFKFRTTPTVFFNNSKIRWYHRGASRLPGFRDFEATLPKTEEEFEQMKKDILS